jgi:ClpP class serine protease
MSAQKTAMRYERRGYLAIAPKAFFELFFMDARAPENSEVGDAVIVDIRGPLEQHAHYCYDSYEAITARVAAACETAARTVILRFDSPGGEVAGCFETARALRTMCSAAGKRLFAFAEGDCCSAAYALASAAECVVLAESALIGSIGVLVERCDVSARNAADGVRVQFITSGARKADGHPEQPVSDAEIEQMQSIVDSMAGSFFALVAELRPRMSAELLAGLQAKIFHGNGAVAVGLADQLGSLSDVLALASVTQPGATAMADKSPYEVARAALEEAAKGEDANAAAAKRALAALGEGGGDEPKKEEEDPEKEPAAVSEDEEARAEGGDVTEPDGDEPPPKKKESMAAAAYRVAIAAQKMSEATQAELRKRDEVAERARLISSRPDLSAEMSKILQKAPMDLVREHIAGMPKLTGKLAANPRANAAAGGGGVAPTRGAEEGDPNASRLPANEKQALDMRMGLLGESTGVENSAYKLRLGVVKPSAASGAPSAK